MNYHGTGFAPPVIQLCAAALGFALCVASIAAPAMASAEGRPAYQGHCDLPRAGWNEEILRVREAAERECKGNLVARAADRSAAVTTVAQDEFWKLKAQHDALLRSAR